MGLAVLYGAQRCALFRLASSLSGIIASCIKFYCKYIRFTNFSSTGSSLKSVICRRAEGHIIFMMSSAQWKKNLQLVSIVTSQKDNRQWAHTHTQTHNDLTTSSCLSNATSFKSWWILVTPRENVLSNYNVSLSLYKRYASAILEKRPNILWYFCPF